MNEGPSVPYPLFSLFVETEGGPMGLAQHAAQGGVGKAGDFPLQ